MGRVPLPRSCALRASRMLLLTAPKPPTKTQCKSVISTSNNPIQRRSDPWPARRRGDGKRTVLSVLREAAGKVGYRVGGFAPTTRAAKQLGESGIQTETLQKFLRRRQEPTTSKQIFVLDESSLASTKQLHKFFRRLEAEDKVLLVGDVRQHQAGEAGSPFEQLQKHGMTTAQLNEIVRQRDPALKQTVAKLSVRNIREAVAGLESRGKVIEIPNEQKRLERIAQDYSKQPTKTLVIAPANRERSQLNSLIHQQLQREGKVSRSEERRVGKECRS